MLLEPVQQLKFSRGIPVMVHVGVSVFPVGIGLFPLQDLDDTVHTLSLVVTAFRRLVTTFISAIFQAQSNPLHISTFFCGIDLRHS